MALFHRMTWTLPWLLIVMASTSACSKLYTYSIEVTSGHTLQDNLKIASSVVTHERLAQLKDQIRARLADVTDADLERIGLNYAEVHQASRTRVVVNIIVGYSDRERAERIVHLIASILSDELNRPTDETPSSLDDRPDERPVG